MNFRGMCALVCGVDVSAAVFENPFLDTAKVIAEGQIPFETNSFDVVFSDNVLEHLVDPVSTFKEIRRVLKPGGVFVAKTPNRLHYMPMIAALTPLWFHKLYNNWRGRKTDDTFPTMYRANTEADLRRHASDAQLTVKEISFVEGRPEYLRIAFPTYLAGLLYEKLVNSSGLLRRFRCVVMVTIVRGNIEI